MRRKITAEELRARLRYDPETGEFSRPDGGSVGCLNPEGYVAIRVARKQYRAHRLAWLYVTGSWPKNEIDHINRVRHDNRIANLRDVTRLENNDNRIAPPKPSGRPLGVDRGPEGHFRAKITCRGRRFDLGYYQTPEEAHEVYLRAVQRARSLGIYFTKG
jgi:hypothetical protein